MSDDPDFAGPAKKHLEALGMASSALDQALAHATAEGGDIRLNLYRAPKIEKIVFCDIRMEETGVVERSLLVWPDDLHNFPVLWCNLTIVPGVMNVPVCDFIPMMDIVVRPDYAATYIEPLAQKRQGALETFGDNVLKASVDLPSRTVHALSPYRLAAMITDAGIAQVPGVIGSYVGDYVKLVSQAEPIADDSDRTFYLAKKAATRALMKANDPGEPFLMDVFGEDLTKQVFDLVF